MAVSRGILLRPRGATRGSAGRGAARAGSQAVAARSRPPRRRDVRRQRRARAPGAGSQRGSGGASRRVLEMITRLVGPENARVALVLLNHGETLTDLRRFDEAEAAIDSALSIWRARSASPFFEGYGLTGPRASSELAAGATREARDLLERAIAMLGQAGRRAGRRGGVRAGAGALGVARATDTRAIGSGAHARAQLAGRPTPIESARPSRPGCANAARPSRAGRCQSPRLRGRGRLYSDSRLTSVRREMPSSSAARVWLPAQRSSAARMCSRSASVDRIAAPATAVGLQRRPDRRSASAPVRRRCRPAESSTVIGPPSDSTTARSITLRSWRMLPGHW